jgi:hypothetical protein
MGAIESLKKKPRSRKTIAIATPSASTLLTLLIVLLISASLKITTTGSVL